MGVVARLSQRVESRGIGRWRPEVVRGHSLRTKYFSFIALWCSAMLHRLSSLVRSPLARSSAHLRVLVVSLLLATTLLAGFNTPFAYGMGGSRAVAQKPAPQGTPHKVDPKSGTKSVLHQPPASKAPPAGPT